MTVRYTPGVTIRLDGPAEQVRRNHDQRIAELAAAAQRTPRGIYLGRQVLTGGVGTYTPASGATGAVVRMVGGGGGGGGAGGAGAGLAYGGGGNSGYHVELHSSSGSSLIGGAFSCGAGGAAGSTAPGPGGTGGDTTIALNGVTYTAKGGTGGTGASIAASGITGPNLPATQPSSGIDVITLGQGGLGFWFGGAAGASGRGGDPPMGRGGVAVGGGGGNSGVSGGGGSGGVAATGFSNPGGAGGDGLIIIDEYA